MHLKHLQVVGFKSFADRIKLDFEPGLTSIVGPNGCGKSNVIDAFRWCLGEMSAKSLRSSLMMDVIFNGSGSRPPVNMSEVILTFDNSDKRLPIDFSEVSVSRRLFRSGESEYFINKTQCRLRDIRELFLDTGMGEDGYAFMAQGKVEWVLQAKPEERRELFEEAAGVSKYRARREEALRKLDRVEIDLSRINDIVSVTNDQIRKLENAVNRAKTYERIRGELKTMEVGDWLHQINVIKEKLEKNQTELKELTDKNESLNTELHQHEATLAEFRRKMTETEEQLLEANGVLAAIDADIKIGEERLSGGKQREQELVQQLQSIKESIEHEKTRLTELQEQEAKQQVVVNEFRVGGEDIKTAYEESKNTCEAALQNLESKQQEIKQAREFILQRAQERASLQQQTANFASDVSRFQSRLENNEKDLERVNIEKEREEALSQGLESQKNEFEKQLNEKTTSLDELTKSISDAKEQEQKLQEQLLSLTEGIAKLKGQIHSIEEQQSQDPYVTGTKAIMAAGHPRVYGPIGQLFQCDESDRDIVSAAIGEHLGDLIAETTEDAQRVIEDLAISNKGRARIWILDKIPEKALSPELAHIPRENLLLGKIRCEDQFQPLLDYLCSDMLVQESHIYGEAVINGGIDPSKWQSHITLRLPELQASLAEQETHKKQLEASNVTLSQEISGKTLNREVMVKELEEVRIRFELSQEEAGKIQERLGLVVQEKQAIEQEQTQNREGQQKAQTSLEETQRKQDELHQKEKEDHEKLDLMQQELTELQHVHSNANADLSTKQEQFNSYQEKLSFHESVLDHHKKDFETLQESLKQHESGISQLETEVGNSKTTQQEAQSLIETSLEKRKGASEACSEIQNVRVKLAEDIETTDKKLNEVRQQAAEVQEGIQSKRIEGTSLENHQETLVQKLKDQYEMDVETAKEKFELKEAQLETLEKLKKRVNNMGPINLAAPQEHAELLEKSQFLTTQQTDLVKAKEDLRQVITKINATTREHFRETFDQVRSNFKTLYSQLFRGGEADLQLSNEADVLSSGIDIFCQPPGKKLLHISLLSGGEKALTACALLFAFFQVRPSPVCLLDEVDAPLDEANVVRFVEMVQKFSEKTQFIVITHNKRTMEAANYMYGVTMEDFGVSKILSARLQQKEKKDEAPAEAEPATA